MPAAWRFAGGARLTTANGYVGYDSGTDANVTVSGPGASWLNTNLFVGYRGNGSLLIADGMHVTAATASIGNDASYVAHGTVKVDGIGSTLDAQTLKIGAASVGALTVSNGGVAKARYDSSRRLWCQRCVEYRIRAGGSGSGAWCCDRPG